jgi:pimeloyl-ACP methyl ester carboxylesterase
MRRRLIILSDLWGVNKSQWVDLYLAELNSYFEVKYYDCCELGDVRKSVYTEENLHHQFANGGIERAVEKLAELEQDHVAALAFSVGGTIAWKFGLKTQRVDSLYCVSSTRLRYENATPTRSIALYYGEKDEHKPQQDWFRQMGIAPEIVKDGEHLIYADSEFAKRLCRRIQQNLQAKMPTYNQQ